MKTKIYVICLTILMFISLTSAVSLDKTNLVFTDSVTSSTITFSQPATNITTITFTKDSSLDGKISLSLSQLQILSSGQLAINLETSLENGNYFGNLYWNATDGTSGIIPIFITITQSNPTDECKLNPSIISYTQSVQQGTEFELPKITFNPNAHCLGTFSITSAYVTGGITTIEGQKPVYIKSATSSEIIIGVNTVGLSSRTYNTKLTVTAFGKTFSEVSNIDIIVTTGTDPANNFTLNDLPTCSVSRTTLALNNTYSLVCTGIQPDVTVSPSVDSDYIVGTSVETTSSQYMWYFKPIKLGSTDIKANFYYRGSTVGTPFNQKVSILSTGGGGGGTTLKFVFTPSLDKAKPNENVIVQVVDNLTGSLQLPLVYANSILLNSSDDYSFNYIFQPNVIYSFRAKVSGYEDLVADFSLTSQEMNISILPSDYDSNTILNISTPGVNATLFINGQKQENPYIGSLNYGNNTIKAISEGYFDKELTIDVKPGIVGSLQTEWKKGVEQIILLNKDDSWVLIYKKTLDSDEKILFSGNSGNVTFTPKDKGFYTLKVTDKTAWANELTGWNWKIWGLHLIWWGVIIVALIIVILVIKNKSSGSSSSSMPGMGGVINYG